MSSVEMEEEHSGQREQQVKECKGACVTGAERIKRQRIKSKVRGQQRVRLHRALQITVGTLAFALKKGGGSVGSLECSEQRRGDLGFNRILLAAVHEWKAEDKGRTRVMSQASSGMVWPGSWW